MRLFKRDDKLKKDLVRLEEEKRQIKEHGKKVDWLVGQLHCHLETNSLGQRFFNEMRESRR